MTRVFGGLLLLLSVWLACAAFQAQGISLVLVWPAVSLTTVGTAYLLHRPVFLGKLDSGKIHLLAHLLCGPYFVSICLVWKTHQLLTTSAPRVSPLCRDVFLGPRLTREDALSREIQTVCDLTSEFSESAGLIKNRHYIFFPILDAGAPLPGELLELCRRLDQSPRSLYIHCAQGFGRTGLVASALLLFRGLAASPEDALQQVTAARPGVSLNHEQRRCLETFQHLLKEDRSPRTDH